METKLHLLMRTRMMLKIKSPSSCYRYLDKLDRYFLSSRAIATYLVFLHRKGMLKHNAFQVKTVSGFKLCANAEEEGDYTSFRAFLASFHSEDRPKCYIREDLNNEKIKRLEDTWLRDRKRERVVHCELQLILFYMLRPNILPIGYFIGVNKYCCRLCALVIK